MNKDFKTSNYKKTAKFESQVRKKATQKIKARNNPAEVWFGLGMMGLIGWSIVIPTLLGATLGIWLDKHYQEGHSWTLVFLLAGLCVGCVNAWYWMRKQHQAMQDQQEQKKQKEEFGND